MKPDTKADILPDIKPSDRGENVGLLEPMRLSEDVRERGPLLDLALELATQAAALHRSLPQTLVASVADLVRSMNCYYSNLIENHYTHPIDIERAMNHDYSRDEKKRDLQREARAHILVQQWIDQGGLAGRATTVEALRETHFRFCAELSEELLWVEYRETGERLRLEPGQWRLRDVRVGNHVPVSPGAVPRFMDRFEQGYRDLGRTEAILAIAAAHHRFAWIHPFLDGNGRVARLMSHGMLLEVVGGDGLWSVARGLARQVDEYKKHLAACDMPRRNDLDGRGHLSQEALLEFTRFFLSACLDQVQFMEGLMQPALLRTRILQWAAEEVHLGRLHPRSGQVLEAILYRGELPKAALDDLLGVTERQSRRIVAPLAERGVFVSAGPREPYRLAFPAALAHRWMPGLFPDKPDEAA